MGHTDSGDEDTRPHPLDVQAALARAGIEGLDPLARVLLHDDVPPESAAIPPSVLDMLSAPDPLPANVYAPRIPVPETAPQHDDSPLQPGETLQPSRSKGRQG